jgi:hypothetical protein
VDSRHVCSDAYPTIFPARPQDELGPAESTVCLSSTGTFVRRGTLSPRTRRWTVMKRSYFALAFVFAGTAAGAYMIAPAPGATVSSTTGSNAKDKSNAQPVAAVPASVVSTIATRRPPVPLLLTKRPGPIATAGTLEIASRDPTPPTADAISPDPKDAKAQAGFAKTAIEQDGYKGVKGLAKGDDGVWRGRALRGSTEIAISVDPGGNVSAE